MQTERNEQERDAAAAYRSDRIQHWDAVATGFKRRERWRNSYRRRLVHVYRLLVAPGQRVLELGCGKGDVIAALEPSKGVGVDFSARMIEAARENVVTPARTSAID